ncbi:TOBE domain-containing protein [Limisalsivibrio acetivorans]|uniref:TOBE domain-containing protein n=1 Tax=Limisalsivibrio acetivorans TaxID=1304888 RepID=UPI0003B62E63|nr:TOBE domain-containing protein [Limisalsivibrio acetivorans]
MDKDFSLDGEIGFKLAGKGSITRKRIELLRAVRESGSISSAAKKAGMSYKGAWDSINTMNEISPETLVQSKTGGSGGGGAQLTEYAEDMLRAYDFIEKRLFTFVKEAQDNLHDFESLYDALRRLSMRTSARNQYFGRVVNVSKGEVNASVEIELKGGDTIASVITLGGLERLGIEEGMEAWAIVKSSSVIIAEPELRGRLSARNFLEGVVESIEEGAVNTSVRIRLNGGSELTGVVTKESAEAMDIKVGKAIAGAFKASAVILGITD